MHNLEMSRKEYDGSLLKDVCGVGMEQPLWINVSKREVISLFQFKH